MKPKTAPKRIEIKLAGTITAIDPINISSPSPERPDMRHEPGIQWMPIVVDGSRVYVPHIRGGTIRGKLRHLGALLLRQANIEQTGAGMDVADYTLLATGGVKESGSELQTSFHVADMISSVNPHLGLFGMCDPIFMAGALIVQNAIPATDSYALSSQGHSRHDPYRSDRKLREETSDEQLALHTAKTEDFRAQGPFKKKLAELDKERIAARKKGDVARLATIDAEIAATTAEMGKKISSPLMPFSRNAIAPGSTFTHGFRLCGTENEVGHFLTMLKMLSNDCTLGGLKSVGYGRFKAEYAIEMRTSMFDPYKAAGHIVVEPDNAEITNLDPALQAAMANWLKRMTSDVKSLILTRDRIEQAIRGDASINAKSDVA